VWPHKLTNLALQSAVLAGNVARRGEKEESLWKELDCRVEEDEAPLGESWLQFIWGDKPIDVTYTVDCSSLLDRSQGGT
jgi:hypothetical protein